MVNSKRPDSPGRIARFGIFEVDVAAGELRKGGVRIRLQEQPFQVLLLLLERPGDVITREDVKQKLWPSDTFVDFDHGLNTAVNKLREALSDSANSPRYVETLARRGYRFLAPVQWTPESGKVDSVPPATAQAFHPELEIPTPNRLLARGLFALIQIMYLIFYLVALFRLYPIEGIVASFLPAWASFIVIAIVVTAGVGIALRCYLLSAAAFDYRRLGEKFLRIFPLILALDQLWAITPLLLAETIGFGLAFAATAALVYVPFAERTLVRMAYRRNPA